MDCSQYKCSTLQLNLLQGWSSTTSTKKKKHLTLVTSKSKLKFIEKIKALTKKINNTQPQKQKYLQNKIFKLNIKFKLNYRLQK